MEWIGFEQLSGNDLPLPSYASDESAGFDLAACLTRACRTTTKQLFMTDCDGKRLNVSADFVGRQRDHSAPPPRLIFEPSETILVPLGLKSEFGNRYVLHLHVRSSVGISGLMLANSTAVVDPDYTGEIFAPLWNRTQQPITIEHGQRIVQGVLSQCARAIIERLDRVRSTKRGDGGFGSTGKTVIAFTHEDKAAGPRH